MQRKKGNTKINSHSALIRWHTQIIQKAINLMGIKYLRRFSFAKENAAQRQLQFSGADFPWNGLQAQGEWLLCWINARIFSHIDACRCENTLFTHLRYLTNENETNLPKLIITFYKFSSSSLIERNFDYSSVWRFASIEIQYQNIKSTSLAWHGSHSNSCEFNVKPQNGILIPATHSMNKQSQHIVQNMGFVAAHRP